MTPTSKISSNIPPRIPSSVQGNMDGKVVEPLNGKGELLREDGTLFIGDFVNGNPEGYLKITYPNGDVYVGEYRGGKLEGRGILYMAEEPLPNGEYPCEVHEGTYKKGKMEGYGATRTHTYSFRGNVVHSEPNGYGIEMIERWKKPDHSEDEIFYSARYEGMFKNGRYCGEGTKILRYVNGSWIVLHATFNNDEPLGQCSEHNFDYATGILREFKGEFLDNETETGTTILSTMKPIRKDITPERLYYSDYVIKHRLQEQSHKKIIYTGTLKNNLFSGKGERKVLFNGMHFSTYVGDFKEGVPHGNGTETIFIDGRQISHSGQFENNSDVRTIHQLKSACKKMKNGGWFHSDPQSSQIHLRISMQFKCMLKDSEKIKKSIEEYRKDILQGIQKRLTPTQRKEQEKQREAELEALYAEFQKSGVAKENKGKQKQKQKAQAPESKSQASSSSSSSSSSSNAPKTEPKTAAFFDPIRQSPAKSYKIHQRIHRWKTNDLNVIRGFKDYPGGVEVQAYTDLDDEDLQFQRMSHLIPGPQALLGPKNENSYYFKTERGFSMLAELVLSDKAGHFEFGYVSIGIGSDNIIFHQHFTPMNPTEIENFYHTPEIASPPKTESTDEFQIKGDYSYEVLLNKVVEFRFPGESHKLRIYPLN